MSCIVEMLEYEPLSHLWRFVVTKRQGQGKLDRDLNILSISVLGLKINQLGGTINAGRGVYGY